MKLGQKSGKTLVGFLRDLKTPKIHSEINLHLCIDLCFTFESMAMKENDTSGPGSLFSKYAIQKMALAYTLFSKWLPLLA